MNNINLNNKTIEIVKEKNNECVNCKLCFKSCPMMKEYSSSPKELMEEIIKNKSVDKNIPYSCMACNVCKVKCPKDIDLKEMFYNLRKDVISNDSKNLKGLGYNTIKFHQINSFSSIFSSNYINGNTKKVFLPGCSLSSYSPDIVMKTYDYLKSNIEDISLLIKCCGKPTLAMGDEKKFKDYYSKLEKIFKENEIEEVIVACANCLDTIKNNSKDIKVTSLWSVINEIKIPSELINNYDDISKEFSLHDPCPIRYEIKIHDDVRNILNDLGVKVVEFDKNIEKSECCGAGAMVRVTNPAISIKQTKKRASEAKSDTVVSYCQSCCESMLSVGKNSLHILDFIFNDDVINKNKFTQDKTSVIHKWKMRYKTAKQSKDNNF